MSTCDVLIIGAGLSALQAARTLQRQPSREGPASGRTTRIVILEARSRVGGRALTYTTDQAHAVDLGCSMIHGYYEGNPARQLLKQLEMDVHIPQGSKGLVYGDEPTPLTEADANSLFSTSTQMAFKPQPGQTPSHESVAEVLFPTLVDKANDERLVAIARTAEIGAGIELEKTSAKWTGFEKGVGGTDAFPEGGYSEVVQNLVADFKALGGEIKLDEQVVRLEDLDQNDDQSPDGVTGADRGIQVTTKSGSTFKARYVLSTIPLSVLQKSPPTFLPPLSETFLSAVERTVVGNLEKIVLVYSKPWWPGPDTNGSFLLLPLSTAQYSPSKSATAPPPSTLRELFERTTIPVVNFQKIASTPHPILLAYIGAHAARHLSQFSPRDVANELHDYVFDRLRGDSEPGERTEARPIDSVVTNWTLDPFSLGATSTPTTLTKSRDGTEASPLDFVVLARPEWRGRLGFAGEHTDLDNHGSVCGALLSGKREGDRVAVLLDIDERKLKAS